MGWGGGTKSNAVWWGPTWWRILVQLPEGLERGPSPSPPGVRRDRGRSCGQGPFRLEEVSRRDGLLTSEERGQAIGTRGQNEALAEGWYEACCPQSSERCCTGTPKWNKVLLTSILLLLDLNISIVGGCLKPESRKCLVLKKKFWCAVMFLICIFLIQKKKKKEFAENVQLLTWKKMRISLDKRKILNDL